MDKNQIVCLLLKYIDSFALEYPIHISELIESKNKEVYTKLATLCYMFPMKIEDFTGTVQAEGTFEECTKEEYDRLIGYVKDIDLTKVREEEDNTDLKGELACSGGACEIK
jgi:hypothetical protein